MNRRDDVESLLDLVAEALSLAGDVSATTPLREAATSLPAARWGIATVSRAPELTNIAMLALLGRTRLVVHQVRPAAARQVDGTDLHSLPDAPPRLLRGPRLLEIRRPEAFERLWGDTVSLASYEVEPGLTYLVGLGSSRWCHVATWRPQWTGGELEAGTWQATSALVDDLSAHQEWAREAARFAVVLGLLLDSEGAPLRVEEERHRDIARRVSKDGVDAKSIRVRHVYLDEERVA